MAWGCDTDNDCTRGQSGQKTTEHTTSSRTMETEWGNATERDLAGQVATYGSTWEHGTGGQAPVCSTVDFEFRISDLNGLIGNFSILCLCLAGSKNKVAARIRLSFCRGTRTGRRERVKVKRRKQREARGRASSRYERTKLAKRGLCGHCGSGNEKRGEAEKWKRIRRQRISSNRVL